MHKIEGSGVERSEISMLISLVVLEIERCGEANNETSSYHTRLTEIQKKLLTMLASMDNPSNPNDGDLPEFREYARIKYGTELNEDLITMVEDLIEMRRQGIR